MEAKKKHEGPTIVEWLGEKRGDNLAIKHGRRIYTVDCSGNLHSRCYKRAEVSPLTEGTYTSTIEGLTDLKPGYTYTISKSPIVVGKVLESHLFGYRFLCFGPEGNVSISDMDYEEVIRHYQDGDIKIVQKLIVED